jgi:hypothetical protein
MKSKKDAAHEKLYQLAHTAGLAAAERTKPTPMVVQEHANVFDDNSPVVQSYHVPQGPCGFAWIIVRPGTCSFARWLRKTGRGEKAYHGGMQVWVSGFDQSIQLKEAYAEAFARVLQDNSVNAYAQSRLD